MIRFVARPRALLGAFSLLGALALLGMGAAQAASPELLRRGAAIARHNCATCHAVGRTGASPNPKSPPFRELSRRYPLSNLEEALGEGIVVGHEGPEMPPFRLDSAQVEALLAYLGSIQKR
jgi:mono/diheme cytochrome c family protein